MDHLEAVIANFFADFVVAHKIFGVPQTINSANYIYFLAFQQLQQITPSRSDYEIQNIVTGNKGLKLSGHWLL